MALRTASRPTPTTVRVVLILSIGLVLAIIAGDVFDRFLWELLLAPPLPAVAALTTRVRRWSIRVAAVAAAIATGVVAAVWSADGSLDAIGPGLTGGPRRVLTTEWPSPAEPTVIGTIALLLAGLTALAAVLAVSERFHLAPLAPLAIGLIVLIALSAPHRPEPALVAVAGVLALVLALTGAGTSAHRGGHRSVLVDRTVPITAAALATIAIATSGSLAWADRADPRSTEAADLSAAVLDPIEATVALRQADPPIELMQISGRSAVSGATLPSRWRVAALAEYDGQRWVPRLTLRPIGGTLDATLTAVTEPPSGVRYAVEYLTDDLDIVPFPGRPISVSADVDTDLERVVVRLRQRPHPGQTVVVVGAVAPNADAARSVPFATRQVDEIAATFSGQAATLAGDGTVIERLQRIEQTMRTQWRLDPSAPGGGQQLALLERFATETRRGTREQFVTAFVVLVRSLGFDARVATGFVVPPEQLGSLLTITSAHASTWPEVRLERLGWVAFDPVPPVENSDVDEPPPPPEAQSPAVAQPPIAPPAEPADDIDDEIIDDRAGDDGWRTVRIWLLRVGAVTGVSLVPVIVIVGSLLEVKRRRRRRRLRVDDPSMLIRGVWANTTDALVDAGLSIAASWTDDRIAERAAPHAPAVPHELRRLAAMSAAVTFGATSAAVTSDTGRLANDARLTSQAVIEAIRAPLTRRQRIRWWLSLRSLRRTTRSPVVV